MGDRTPLGWLRIPLAGLLAVLTVTALALTWIAIRPGTLKPLAAHLSERLTQRTLAIDGGLDLAWSLSPRITASGVRFGNAPGSASPDMLTAGHVSVQIDLRELFARRLHVLDLGVSDAHLILEDSVGGGPNWALPGEGEEDASGDGSWDVLVEGLNITNARIDAILGELEPIRIDIPHLAETGDASGDLHLDGHGTINGEPWRIDGRIGPVGGLIAAGRIELDLQLSLDEIVLSIDGTVGELASLTGVDATFNLQGPDADLLGSILQSPGSFHAAVALSGRIRPAGAGHALALDGQLGEFQIAVAGTVLDLNALDGWDATVDLTGPDAGVPGKILQIRGLNPVPFQVHGGVHLHGGDLDLSNVIFTSEDVELRLSADFQKFPGWEGAVGGIRLAGGNIAQFSELFGINTLPDAPFELNVSFDAGRTEKITGSLDVGSHRLTAAGFIGEYPRFHGTRLTASLEGGGLGEILRIAGLEKAPSGPYRGSVVVSIDGNGLSLADGTLSTGLFTFAGSVDFPRAPDFTDFRISGEVTVADVSEAGALIDPAVEGLPTLPLTLQGELRHADGQLQLLSGSARFHGLRGEATGILGSPTDLSGLDLEVSLEGADLEKLFMNAIPDTEREIPFTASSRIHRTEGALELSDLLLTGEHGSMTGNGRIGLNPEAANGILHRFRGSRLHITGQGRDLSRFLPSIPAYRPPAEPWELSLEVALPDGEQLDLGEAMLTVGSVRLSASGILDAADQTRTDLQIEARGDSFTELGKIGVGDLPDMPFQIGTTLKGSLNSISVNSLDARWGDSDIQASGTVDLTGKPKVVLRGRSSKLILVDLQQAIFGEQEDIDPTDDATRIFPDTPIPIGELERFDADVDVEVTSFRGRRLSMEDITLKLKVEDGALLLDRASYRDQIGSFETTATVRPVDAGVAVALRLTGSDADLRLFTTGNQPQETVPLYDLDVDIRGTGRTVAEVAGNLSGNVLIASEGGNINNALLQAFAGDFLSNVLEVLNPFTTGQAYTAMDCMVLNAGIRDGVVRFKPGYVMRTDRVNMFVLGSIDLENEALDLSLATQARRGIGISAATITNPYFKIGGTLRSPALALDPASAAVAASVATATAGLSVVVRGIWDRLQGERNPCPSFLEPPKQKGG